MGARVDVTDRKGTIILDGEITVRYAAEIKDILLKTLDEADEIIMQCAAVTTVDLAGLQLICSIHRSITLAGKRLFCAGLLPDAMRKIIAEAGYDRLTGCRQDDQKSCFWVQDAVPGDVH